MPVTIEDDYLEQQIMAEQSHRGDATKSKTASSLLRERLVQLEYERRSTRANTADAPTAHGRVS